MTQLSAIDALGRGIANVRANRELLLVQLAALVVLFCFIVASILPIGLALGLGLADFDGSSPAAWRRLLEPGSWLTGGVVAALAFSLVVSTAAVAAYSWFQAGIFGVLVAGDRQAGAGAHRPWALFRTFSSRDFAGWARLRTLRFFAWYHLYLTVVTALMFGFALLLGGAVALGIRRGPLAGFGLGCGGALPLVFLAFYLSLTFAAAKADLMRPESGAIASWRRGARVVAKRLGGSLLLLLIFVAASSAASMVLLPVQLVAEVALHDQLAGYVAVQIVITFVQWAAGAVLGLVYGAAFVALVRAELPDAA